jgi:glucose/arabinose dehydrogenase
MKTALWWWAYILGGLLTVQGQGLSKYAWTNIVAFPGLPTFASPICIASPPGETNRLFVCEHGGNIVVITNLAAPTRTVFLNLTARVTLSGEAGLLAVAFHPGFATNGYFYVSYNVNTNSSLADIVSRFKVSAANTNQGDATSETRLYVQTDRASNHNGGDLHFGPDNYLYVSLGDEGNEYNTLHNAQHIDGGFFAGMLRIDVDKLPGSLVPNTNATAIVTTNYAVPPDNPFVGATTFDGVTLNTSQLRTEFWAVGLRNPWRFSFDPITGILYCGDVGQDTVEEIDIIKKGGNYGWASYEGHLSPPPGVTTNGQPVAQNVTFPIFQYNHGSGATNGNCIIGGVVYRGSRFPELNGAYVYGDYVSKKFWATFYDGTNAANPVLLFSAQAPTAFGVDPRNGDVLYCADGTSSLQRIIGLTPTINSISFSTPNILLSGAGGPPGSNYYLLTSTDLVSWINSFTGQFDTLANFQLTNSTDTNGPQKFYRISR